MTTTYAPIAGMAGLITPIKSNAQSEPAKWLLEKQEEIRGHLLTSYVMRNATEAALEELDEVSIEASDDGWDGYGGKAVNPMTYVLGRFFLNALPTTAPTPEVSADPDGEISFDWVFGERKALTVSVSGTGRCTFAWMVGQSTIRGTDWIQDEIPAPIAFALRQLAGSSTAPNRG